MTPETFRDHITGEILIADTKGRVGNFISSLDSRRRRVLSAATAAGALLVSSVAAQAAHENSAGGHNNQTAASAPMPYTGISSNEIFTFSADAAETNAKEIVALGGNTARIFVPYTRGEAHDITNDRKPLCNAMRVASDNHLNLVMSFIGYHGEDAGRGFIPESYSQTSRFIGTLAAIMWTAKQPDCAPNFTEFRFEPMNEINSPDFNTQLNEKTADRYVRWLGRVSRALSVETQKPELEGRSVEIIAGALAPGHDPRQFLRNMVIAAKKYKLTGDDTPFDALSVHLYPTNGNSITQIARNLYPELATASTEVFGNAPILYDEVGVETDIPKSMQNHYELASLARPSVSQAQQAREYEELAHEVACNQPLAEGILFFTLKDDGVTFKSGIKYPNGRPKNSYKNVQKTVTDLSTGNQKC